MAPPGAIVRLEPDAVLSDWSGETGLRKLIMARECDINRLIPFRRPASRAVRNQRTEAVRLAAGLSAPSFRAATIADPLAPA